jgi:SAM-dependent methyltransferase
MPPQREEDPPYLRPYRDAARRHGGAFASLLWASRHTQALRFDALIRLFDFGGRRVLDVGAGRGDLLGHLLARGVRPAHYFALEAVDPLADEIERRAGAGAGCTIIRADFVREPGRMLVGADAVVFSGSLNTLEPADAYAALERAFHAAGEALVFNFLSDPCLAAARHLHWHRRGDIERLIASLSPRYELLDDYLEGDCSAVVRKR